MLSARSFETGDEDGDQEIPGEDDDEDMEDGSASDDSDQMLDVERKARDIDRDRYTPTPSNPMILAQNNRRRGSLLRGTILLSSLTESFKATCCFKTHRVSAFIRLC